jgi:hypothetical protein
MALPEYGSFQVGAVQYPLITTSGNTPLQDADSALFFALDFWAAMLNVYLGARMLAEAGPLGFAWKNSAGTPSVVVQQYPYDVGPYLQDNQVQFPLLAAWRTTEKYKQKTASYFDDDCKISVAWMLPPLTAGQAERLLPFLRAGKDVLRNRTDQGWDPNYTPPGGSGPTPGPFNTAFAYVEEIGFTDGSHGVMPGAGNLVFPTLLMHGFIIERDNDVPDSFSGRPKFAGGDITANLTASDLTTVPSLVQAATQQAPTITGLSLVGGPIAGGSSVTISGTLFLPNPQVLFGNTPASSVVWNSAVSITCMTTAVSGPGTVDVVVTNRDGQSVTDPQAFTFS